MKQVRTAPAAICSQCHVPRSECDPDKRHTQPLRASDRLMRKVEAKAASLGLSGRNAGIEAALEAWTAGVDEDATPPLVELLAEVRVLREQVSHLSSGEPMARARKRTVVTGGTAVFLEPDPDAEPVSSFPVPEVPDHSRKRGRR